MTEKKKSTEKDIRNNAGDRPGDRRISLGNHWSYNLLNDPKRLAFVLSRYKFAAKMGSRGKRVLELGCSEGIGAPIIAETAISYTGIDMDESAIETARESWRSDKMSFVKDDFLSKTYGTFDTVLSLDVVEHIEPASEHLFFETIYDNLADDGISIVGTPNVTSAQYASAASQAGHVNLFDAERLKKAMQRLFHSVFVFGMNDEVVHTGYSAMSHYFICIGCNKRKELLHA